MAVHKELVSAGKFNEKIRSTLRDYYSYGFKNLESGGAASTVTGDWDRLTRILADYFEWSRREDRRCVMFAAEDSQTMDCNPFHRVYRFCSHNPMDPVYFFHTLAALSPEIELAGGIESLPLGEEDVVRLIEKIEQGRSLTTSELLLFYGGAVPAQGRDRTRTPNNRLQEMADQGFLVSLQEKGKKGGPGERRWKLNRLTMRDLLEAGKEADRFFPEHFRYALDFFSRSLPLGEAGIFLLDRTGEEYASPFRFSHAYFMQSLEDVNLIDLLAAADARQWILVSYHHAVKNFTSQLLGFPLQARISGVNGRQHLMIYEPIHRSCTALRLEFMDEIRLVDFGEGCRVLGRDEAEIRTEIARCRRMLDYAWGVSTSTLQTENAARDCAPQPVHLRIEWDPETEGYIRRRMERESRQGRVTISEDGWIDFDADIADPVEMRPWIRSFYGRLLEGAQRTESDTSWVREDLDQFRTWIKAGKPPAGPASSHGVWTLPQDVLEKLSGAPKARNHEQIFNPCFSIYFYIMADVLTRLCGGEKEDYSRADIKNVIDEILGRYYLQIGAETDDLVSAEILDMLLSRDFARESDEGRLVMRYRCRRDLRLYRDLIPLTNVELSWLKMMLKEPDIRLFLSDREIEGIEKLLTDRGRPCRPIDRSFLYCYDRFTVRREERKKEAAALPVLLDAIRYGRTVHLTYYTARGKKIWGDYRPAVIGYSCRTGRLQVYLRSCHSGRFQTFNLSGLQEAALTRDRYKEDALLSEMEDWRQAQMTSVHLCFSGAGNMADRILTELSPWRKYCSHDKEQDLYELVLYYSIQDETEILIRLMGYGGRVLIMDRNHGLGREMQARLEKQAYILERQLLPDRGKER